MLVSREFQVVFPGDTSCKNLLFLPGRGKRGDFSSWGDSLSETELGDTRFAKPFIGGLSPASCFVTLVVDFLKLFHKPTKYQNEKFIIIVYGSAKLLNFSH